MPGPKKWHGDKLAFFGDQIPTTIFATIGAQGWTFEMLCCKVATGKHRENVKTTLRRIEDEGLLVAASRPRGPGFNVRVLTIWESFPAAREIAALLRAYVRVWPDLKIATKDAMARLKPRTKEHLRKRGLI